MQKRRNPSAAAATFANSAFKQLSELKSALQSAEANLSRLNRALHVPVIRPPRTRTARTTSQPSLLLTLGSLGGLAAGGAFLDDFTGSGASPGSGFQQSSTQFAARLLDAALRGQRVR